MIGPLNPQEASGVITSSLATIPKKLPGQWRITVNLSRPVKSSVNDNLKRELTHVDYSSVDDTALLLHHLGQGALKAKTNIKDAYCIIPVHSQERPNLGIE